MIANILGSLHPLLVHLPIGILVLAFLIELASRKEQYRHLRAALSFVLSVALFTAVLSVLTGWVMPKAGAFDEKLLSLHFWFALALAAATAILLYLLSKRDQPIGKYYFSWFLLTMLLLLLTGHYGGSLTHGSTHLTAAMAGTKPGVRKNLDDLLVYEDIVKPLLQKKCAGCHNEEKKKGSLVLNSIQGLQSGGENGPVLIAGAPMESPLIQKIHLPLEAEEHMPPEGKPQLTANEIQVLEWWIAEGANFDKQVKDTPKSTTVDSILKILVVEAGLNGPTMKPPSPSAIRQLQAAGISVELESESSPFVGINLSRDTLISSRKLRKLKALKDHIVTLDLSFSNMNDALMPQLARLEHLRTLRLQGTAVSAEGLKALENLKELQSLNLYDTPVGNQGFETIRKIPSLQSLYLWQSGMTDEAVAAYRKAHPAVMVSYGVDAAIFGDTQLHPPNIEAEAEIFSDSLRVSLKNYLGGVTTYFTVDGTSPDSTATVYDSSFLITATTQVRAIAMKEGWLPSAEAESVFTKAGKAIQSIRLDQALNPKYSANGTKTLIDLERGSNSFSDGKWLGFEGTNVSITLDLGSIKEVSSVVISCLEDTGSYIFFPKGIRVQSAKANRQFTIRQKLQIPIATGGHPPTYKSVLLKFEPVEARYIRIDVQGVLYNPEWHAAPGAKNWIFLDEVIVN